MKVLSVIFWYCLWLMAIVGPSLWLYVLCFTKYWYLSVIYATWIYYDRETRRKGGRRWEFFRRLTLWKSFCQYFPMKIVKTTELDPTKNYMFGYHPHGILSSGLHGNFGMEGNSQVFDGIKMHFLTLDANFFFPIFREICLASSGCSASKESINYLLSKEGGGNGVIVVPGGARESLYCHPGREEIYLTKRKGFIKLAIKNGSPLIPVYSFGEGDIYSQLPNPKGSLLRRIQDKSIDLFGAAMFVLAYGRGPLPRQYPITSVVGAPIATRKMDQPPQSYIDEVHNEYIEALRKLYDNYKDIYGHKDVNLIIH